jgi:hypothetical protein
MTAVAITQTPTTAELAAVQVSWIYALHRAARRATLRP